MSVQELVDQFSVYAEGGKVCTLCSRFIRGNNIHRHMSDNHWDDPSVYECPTCNLVTKKKRNMVTHVKKRHPEMLGIRRGRRIGIDVDKFKKLPHEISEK